jgi:phospho-N-acetylmuramoyl-pentapeptide-transferase
MGGLGILVLWGGCLLLTHRFHDLTMQAVFIFSAGLSFGGIGLLDDLLSLLRKRSLGLSPSQKILLTAAISVALFLAFPQIARVPLKVPFSLLTLSPPLGILPFLVMGWIFVATTNSMNLTDGLDGLATGVTVLILVGYLLLFGGQELPAIILPLVGILVGFLWVNAYPAQLFLGNVGSFALGGVVAAIALVTGTALILPLFAGLLVLEAGSVILQVSFYRLTKRRIFKISPFHHHFEHAEKIDYPYLLPKIEWPEPKITLRLWILQGVFVGLGILATHL